MSLSNHLVIFVKAPRIGAVKTRLAAEIGAVAAWRFYREATNRLLHRVARDRRWVCRLAVAPDRFAQERRLWPAGTRVFPQGGGDLGARMARCMRRLPPGPVVIVGSDVPDIAPRHIAQAFRALRSSDVVFGPAPDGGYWLVGLSRRPRLLEIFGGVEWSSPQALEQTLSNLPPGARVEMLEELEDVDDEKAYARWKRRAEGLTSSRSRRAHAPSAGA